MRKLLIVAVPVLAAAGYFAYGRHSAPDQAPELVTTSVTRGDVVQSVDATGRLEAVTTVQVGSQVSGTIGELYADFNSQVTRGQVIARLEPSLFETQVEQAQATVLRLQADVERVQVQLDDARLKLTRARDLAGQQLVPMTDLETAEANTKTAEANLKAAEAQVVQAEASLNQSKVNLSHTVITAPIDGVVVSRNVNVGQTVAASMQAPTLFQIANDLSQMQVSANVDEADIGQVTIGQAVRFQVDAYPGETFTGTVAQVRLNPVIESNVVSYVTVIHVPNSDLRLKPGMTATVTIEVARARDTLMVPTSALRFSPTLEVLAALGQLPPEQTAEVARGSEPAGEGEGAPVQSAAPTDEQREALRARLAQMTPEERQAVFAARGGRRGGTAPAGITDGRGAGVRARTAPTMTGSGAVGRVWTVVNGQLQPVPVRTGVTDGATVAVDANGLEEGDVIATGIIERNAAAPTSTARSPLLPQFGRRGGGAGGQRGTGGNQPGGARGGQ